MSQSLSCTWRLFSAAQRCIGACRHLLVVCITPGLLQKILENCLLTLHRIERLVLKARPIHLTRNSVCCMSWWTHLQAVNLLCYSYMDLLKALELGHQSFLQHLQ